MDIWDTNKLLLFVAFIIPGFVSLKTYELIFPSVPRESSKQLIDAVAYSCVNYGLLAWPIIEVETHNIRSEFPRAYLAFLAFVLFVAPVSWVCLLKLLRSTQFFQASIPHPTAKPWDYVFGQRKEYWIIVTLKDGTTIAGKYGPSSFASSAPAPEQIYLEERWLLNIDGGFERPRTDTAGVIIVAADIAAVELFNVTYGGSDERGKNGVQRGVSTTRQGLSAEQTQSSGTHNHSGGG